MIIFIIKESVSIYIIERHRTLQTAIHCYQLNMLNLKNVHIVFVLNII